MSTSTVPTALPGVISSSNVSPATINADAPSIPEIEQTLSRFSAYRNVRGIMVLSRRAPPPAEQSDVQVGASATLGAGTGTGTGIGIITSNGAIFEGESGKRYAKAVEGIVSAAAKGMAECDEGDELKLMRIRTKRHELIITPDEKYLLVVLQDPGA